MNPVSLDPQFNVLRCSTSCAGPQDVLVLISPPAPDVDTDGDGYTDAAEVAVGKDPNKYCPIMRADIDGDTAVSILDLSLVAGRFMKNVPPAPARYDQGSPPVDGQINILDLSKMAAVFGKNVSACP